MRILILEGNLYVNNSIMESLEWEGFSDAKSRSNLDDFIYDMFYRDEEFDVIVIGDDLVKMDYKGLEEGLQKHLKKLSNPTFFPVSLGEIIKEICKEKGKKEPKIIIYTTFFYYLYRGKEEGASGEAVIKYITSHNMKYINKTETDSDKQFINMIKEMNK